MFVPARPSDHVTNEAVRARKHRSSTGTQDLTAQRDALAAAGVDPDAIYVDHGFTGTQRERPGVGKALASCRNGHPRGDQA